MKNQDLALEMRPEPRPAHLRKVDEAREALQKSGLLDELEKGRNMGETPAGTLRRIAIEQESAKQKKLVEEMDKDESLFNGILDELFATSQKSAQQQQEIKALKGTIKKQKARIRALESSLEKVAPPA